MPFQVVTIIQLFHSNICFEHLFIVYYLSIIYLYRLSSIYVSNLLIYLISHLSIYLVYLSIYDMLLGTRIQIQKLKTVSAFKDLMS